MSDAAVAGPAPRPAGRRPSPSSAIALASPPARTLLVVVLMAAISQGHGTSVGPFLNEMAAAFHVSLGQMGQLAAAATIGGAVSSLGVLPFVSRLRPRAMLALVALGVAAGTVLTAVTPWFPALYVVRLVTGACNVLALAMGFVVLGRAYAAPAQHAVRVGVVLAASATGPTVGPPALRWIASWSSWQLAQLAYAAAAALVALVVLAAWRGLPAVTEGRATAARARLGSALRTAALPAVGATLAVGGLREFAAGALGAFLAGFVATKYPGQDAWIGLTFSAGGLGYVGGAALSGLAVRWLGGPARAAVVSLGATAVLTALFGWVTVSPVWTAAAQALLAAAMGVSANALLGLLHAYSGTDYGAVLLLNSVLTRLTAVLGTLIGGLAVDATPGFAGWQIAICVAAVVVLAPVRPLLRAARGATQTAPDTGPSRSA